MAENLILLTVICKRFETFNFEVDFKAEDDPISVRSE